MRRVIIFGFFAVVFAVTAAVSVEARLWGRKGAQSENRSKGNTLNMNQSQTPKNEAVLSANKGVKDAWDEKSKQGGGKKVISENGITIVDEAATKQYGKTTKPLGVTELAEKKAKPKP